MSKWKQIDRADVWPLLVAGKDVSAVILENKPGYTRSTLWLRTKTVMVIETLLKDDNVVYFVENEEVTK